MQLLWPKTSRTKTSRTILSSQSMPPPQPAPTPPSRASRRSSTADPPSAIVTTDIGPEERSYVSALTGVASPPTIRKATTVELNSVHMTIYY